MIGDGNPTDYYPTSQLVAGVNAVPAYSEGYNKFTD